LHIDIKVAIITGLLALVVGIAAPLIVYYVKREDKSKTAQKEKEDSKNYSKKWITERPEQGLPSTSSIVGKEHKKLYENIGKTLIPGKNNIVVITGLPGTGKRYFCRLLANELQERFDHIGYFEFCGSTDTLLRQLSQKLGRPLSSDLEKSEGDIKSYLENFNGSLLLFLTRINDQEQFDALSFLCNLPNTSVVVASSIKNLDFRGQRLSNSHIMPLFVDSREAKEYAKTEYPELRNDAVTAICSYAGGVPFLIRALALAFRNAKGSEILIELERRGIHAFNIVEVEECEDGVKRTSIKLARWLERVFQIDMMEDHLKETLGKLSVFREEKFTDRFLIWFKIDYRTMRSLERQHWLNLEKITLHGDVDAYTMPPLQRELVELFAFRDSFDRSTGALIDAVVSYRTNAYSSFVSDFKNMRPYIERIRERIIEQKNENRDSFQLLAGIIDSAYAVCHKDSRKAAEWRSMRTVDNPDQHASIIHSRFRDEVCDEDATDIAELLSRTESEIHDIFQDENAALPWIKGVRLQFAICAFRDDRTAPDAIRIANQVLKEKDSSAEARLQAWYIKIESLIKGFTVSISDVLLVSTIRSTEALAPTREPHAVIDSEIVERLKSALAGIDKDLHDSESRYYAWLCFTMSKAYFALRDEEQALYFLEKAIIISNLSCGFYNKELQARLELDDLTFGMYLFMSPALSENFKNCLERNDVEAMYIQGRLHEQAGNHAEAFGWYEQATEGKSLRGRCALGVLLSEGRGVKKDIYEAERLWREGADLGHSGSCWRLYELYNANDDSRAQRYLQLAAQYGSKRAVAELDRQLD